MKITSGDYKYRKLEVPEGIRPTTEKVREAVFSMVREWIPGAVALDLFAGSGALGLEALSRGAARCYFNEGDRRNYRVLMGNIDNCKAMDEAVCSNSDFRQCLGRINEKLDVIFLDPPYREGYYDEAFDLINEYELLDEGGIVVAEHLYDNPLSETYGRLTRIKEKKYGSIGVDVYICE
ncbi:MAG: 16S rRNA (guanine(966)-N(2))-methyltransferase RsmD [Clostridiales bacterium]|nr:16S rRNA (guanine(966)-N(2))-methyltransferase RsmD [Candidatus Crickella merdequi]